LHNGRRPKNCGCYLAELTVINHKDDLACHADTITDQRDFRDFEVFRLVSSFLLFPGGIIN
jgi:hypothetical protein